MIKDKQKEAQGSVDALFQQYMYGASRVQYEGSLMDFFRDAWPFIDTSAFQSNWMLEGLIDHLEAVTMGHIKRLLINVPPRASKTSSVSIAWPAWTWARSETTFWSGPKVKFLCGSFNSDLALNHANSMRRLILSPWYQKFWGGRYMLTWDQNTKSRFDNTQGGSRISTSVGSNLLGLGGDVIIVDDPHATETEKKIESDADRLKVESWWRELSSTRLNNAKKSAIVVVMQRLHRRDLSGVILDGDEDFVHYCVPMSFDERRRCVTVVLPQYTDDEPWSDPRTREGELMWPERFGEAEVARIERNLGPIMASGRLQQSPVPKGGNIIKREWWQPWDEVEAAKYNLEWSKSLKEFPPMEIVCGSLDTSYGEKQENDYNAMTVWGIWIDANRNRRAMLMFAWAKRMPLHGQVVTAKAKEAKVQFQERQKEAWGLVEWVADTCKRYKVERLLIEDKTRGRDVANEINRLYARENWGVQLINPVGDKVSRMHSIVPLFADSAIWAPDTKWSDEVIKQSCNFPKDEHDDLVDATSMFLRWARENELIVRADEMSAALEEEMTYKTPPASIADQYGV